MFFGKVVIGGGLLVIGVVRLKSPVLALDCSISSTYLRCGVSSNFDFSVASSVHVGIVRSCHFIKSPYRQVLYSSSVKASAGSMMRLNRASSLPLESSSPPTSRRDESVLRSVVHSVH
jgi:hypothetical protein